MKPEAKLITKDKLKQALQDLGVSTGSIVLLQAESFDSENSVLIGGMATLLDALCEIITPKGLLIVPSFTLSCLDPACRKDESFRWPLSRFEEMRQEMPGYSSRTIQADVYADLANSFLLRNRVKRTEHPVYSFAWWGTGMNATSVDSLDYPISYQHILKRMEAKKALNLLVNVPPEEALLTRMEAHEKKADTTLLEHAYVRRVKKTFVEPFLTSRLDGENLDAIAETMDIATSMIEDVPLCRVMRAA